MLNVRMVGELERPGYQIEKLVYEAWAGLPVSAHLYIPDLVEAARPGIGVCLRTLDGSGQISTTRPVLLCCGS